MGATQTKVGYRFVPHLLGEVEASTSEECASGFVSLYGYVCASACMCLHACVHSMCVCKSMPSICIYRLCIHQQQDQTALLKYWRAPRGKLGCIPCIPDSGRQCPGTHGDPSNPNPPLSTPPHSLSIAPPLQTVSLTLTSWPASC